MSDRTPPPATGRIVVGVDGSEPSKLALRWAAFLSRSTGAGIEAVGAWTRFDAYLSAGYGRAPLPDDRNPAKETETLVVDTLEQVFGDDRPPGIRVAVQEGQATRVLLDAGRDAGMIVVGSRGRGGFAGLLLGSVSSACARHATCPVLVVHGDTPPPDGGPPRDDAVERWEVDGGRVADGG